MPKSTSLAWQMLIISFAYEAAKRAGTYDHNLWSKEDRERIYQILKDVKWFRYVG